jgi:hypothetical protein
MGSLLDKAVLAAKELPPAEQDEIALLVLAIAGEDLPVIVLSDDERSSFEASLGQASRGEFAGDEDVMAVWKKHGV